jgi:hypothetical protein
VKFSPNNRHLWVKPHDEIEEESENLKILVPTDYEKPKSPYLTATVLALAGDCRINSVSPEDTVVIERRMLHNVEIEGKNIYLVLENYVYGRIDK